MKIFPDALVYAALGYGVVFVGLILLMAVVVIMGKAMVARKVKVTPGQDGPVATATGNVKSPVVQKLDGPFAPGSAGEIALHGVEPKDAAMVMAIVADKLGKPVNELRFKSIKEVK